MVAMAIPNFNPHGAACTPCWHCTRFASLA